MIFKPSALLIAVTALCFAFAAALDASVPPACTPHDYDPVYGPCDPQRSERTVVITKRGGVACTGPQIAASGTTTCECTLDDLVANVGTCDAARNRQQVISIGVRQPMAGTTNGSCSASQLVQQTIGSLSPTSPAGVPCACTVGDVGSAYTQCVNGVRSVVYFWKRHCTPLEVLASLGEPPATVSLPSPQLAPCDLVCRHGEFLAAPNPTCAKCPAGTHSFVGQRFDAPYPSELPPEMVTECDQAEAVPCTGWLVSPDRSYLYSGNNSGIHDLNSILRLSYFIDSLPAEIAFSIKMETEEHADYFLLVVGGRQLIAGSGEIADWRRLRFEIIPDSKRKPCHWVLGEQQWCVFGNELTPYDPASFFRPDSAPIDIENIIALDDPCTAVQFNPAGGGTAMITGHNSTCTLQSRLRAAVDAGVRVLILCDHVTDGAMHVTGDGFGIKDIVVAIMYHDDLVAARQAALAKPVASLRLAYRKNAGRRTDVSFFYIKDRSVSEGLDRVMIRDIEISGTKEASDSCQLCPPGFGSVAGSSECMPCPQNTFASEPGTPYPCRPCGVHEISAPRSTKCVASLECGPQDYRPVHGMCRMVDGKLQRVVEYEPVTPRVCDPSVGTTKYTPPPPITVPCPPCSDGFERSEQGDCVRCPPMFVTTATNRSCHRCEAGYTPQSSLDYDNFDAMESELPPEWTAVCDECVGSPWFFSTFFTPTGVSTEETGTAILSTGRTVAPGGTSDLNLRLTFERTGSITFTYLVTYPPGHFVELTHYDLSFTIFDLSDPSQPRAVVSQQLGKPADPSTIQSWGTGANLLPAGNYTLRWRFMKRSTATTADVSLSLKSFWAINVKDGFGSGCVMCPLGHQCPDGLSAQKCAPGTHASQLGSIKCRACSAVRTPFSTVAPRPGATNCSECPAGLIANHEETTCILPKCLFYDVVQRAAQTVNEIRQAGSEIPPQNARFDLSALDAVHNVVTTSGTSRVAGAKLDFGLCSASEQRKCVAPGEFSFGCAIGLDGSLTTLGNELRFAAIRDDTNTTTGVLATIGGSRCRTDPKREQFTHIKIMCDAEARIDVVEGNYFTCSYNVTIRSRWGCPQCTNNSFVYQDTPCDERGYFRRVYLSGLNDGTPQRKPICYGGVPFPQSRSIQCPWATITLPAEVNTVWIAILSVVMVMLLLVVVSCYLYTSKRRLYARYSMLANSAANDSSAMHDIVIGNNSAIADEPEEEQRPKVPPLPSDPAPQAPQAPKKRRESSDGENDDIPLDA